MMSNRLEQFRDNYPNSNSNYHYPNSNPNSLGIAPVIIAAAISAGVQVVTGIIRSWKNNQRNKVLTTTIVNEVEPFLQQNLAAYLESNRTTADQAQAVANFDLLWGQVVQACNNPAYGDPGRRCITDRQRGGQWDWFSYYRDPIANDTSVVEVNQIASTLFGENVSSDVFGGKYALMAGLALVGLGAFAVFNKQQG